MIFPFTQVDFLFHKEAKTLLKNGVKPMMMKGMKPLLMGGVDALNCVLVWVQHLEIIPQQIILWSVMPKVVNTLVLGRF